ncbi:MAG: hypothetical protein EOO09_00105 [Chitinophagaceae bacterium]|nr:MAG: hypothetical protein EOO09_00105 [Chitinophagaceae bacterium]
MLLRYLVLLLLVPLAGCGQSPRPGTKVKWFILGEDSISVSLTSYGAGKGPVYVHLHDDETTALDAALPILRTNGGLLLKIHNNGERNIRFTLDSAEYEFDPNRMFSREGITHSLVRHKRISNKSIAAIEDFARAFLEMLPSSPTMLVALHNNRNGSLSVKTYMGEGEEAADAADVSVVKKADPDDFMLTTERGLFDHFRSRFNIVLQSSGRLTQDGSLSVYCGEKGIPYLNCETEHGHKVQFENMLVELQHYLRRDK